MSNIPLLEPLFFTAPKLSFFFLFNLALSFSAFVFALWLLRVNKSLLVRPVFYCAIGWLLLYQAAVTVFSSEFFASLQYPWRLSSLIHLIGFLLLAWCALVSAGSRARDQVLNFDFPVLDPVGRWLPVGLLLLTAFIYLRAVPYDCTGLYALWADARLTLLAREFSIKLVGSSPATYAFGAAANIASPLVVALSLFRARNLFVQGRYIYFLVWISLGGLAIVLVLTSGTKGLLIPTIVMAVIVSLLWTNGWLSRGVMLASAIALLAATMVLFELGRERDGVAGTRYDFAQCVVETGTCDQSMALVQSLAHREGSLGLSSLLVEQIGDRLSCMCSPHGVAEQCPTVGVFAYGLSKGADRVDRAATLFQAILNRALAVPFQVGAWHLMYSESEQVDGWKTLPFSRRMFGESLNMPELVYQKYGTIYSKGDRTSTSTAPTSFLLAYPAYLGPVGMVIAFGFLFIWDVIYVFFAFRVDRNLFPIAAGIAAITGMNFMSSDFVTVLISHGGGVGLLIVAAYYFIARRGRGVRSRQ